MNQNTNGFESHHVIFDFILHKKTGTLHFQPHGRKLYFDNGNLIFANSEHPAEHFSSILVEMEVLDAATLNSIRETLGESKSLGKYLKEEGIATPKQLAQSLKRQITKIIEAVIADPKAVCDSQENAVPSKLPKLKIQTLALVLQAVSHLPDQETMLADLPLEQTIVPTSIFQERQNDLGFPEAYLDFFDYLFRNSVNAGQLGKEFRWGQRLTDSTLYVLYLLGMIEFQAGDAQEEPLHPITIEDEPFHEGEDDDLLADVLPEDQAGPSLDLGEPEPGNDLVPERDEFDGSSTAPHEIEIGADTNPTLDTDFTGFGLAAGMAAAGDQVLDETLSEPIQPGLFEESAPDLGEMDEPLVDPEQPELFGESEPMDAGFGEPDFPAPDDLDETLVEEGGASGFNEDLLTPDNALSDPDDLSAADFSDLGDPTDAEKPVGFEMTQEDDASYDSGSNWSENGAVGFGGFPEEPAEESGFGELTGQEEPAFGEPAEASLSFGHGEDSVEELALDGDDLLLTHDAPDFEVDDLGDEHGLVEEEEHSIDDISLDDAFEKSLAEANGLTPDDFQDLQPDFDPGQTTFDEVDPSDFSDAETVTDPIIAFGSSAETPMEEPDSVPDDATFRGIDDDNLEVSSGVVMPDPEEESHGHGVPAKKSRLPVFALIAICLAAILGGAYYFMFMVEDPFTDLEDPYSAMNATPENTSSSEDTPIPNETTEGELESYDDSTQSDPLTTAQSTPPADGDASEAMQPEPSSSASTDSSAKADPDDAPKKDVPPKNESRPAVAVGSPTERDGQKTPVQDDTPLTVEDLSVMTRDTLSTFKAQDGNFSMVVVVACSPETVKNILNSSAGEDIMVFPRYLENRTCYMVTWGLFDSLQDANNSKNLLPQQLQSSDDPTWVVNLKKYR